MAADQGRRRRSARAAGEAEVEVTVRVARGAHAARVLREAAREFLPRLRRESVSLLLCDDARMREINREWRGKDRPTDVISFPFGPGPFLGDIVISLQTAKRQAKGWPLRMELRRLLAHGMCHCQGYDHEKPAEAGRMAAAERRLLGHEGMVGDAYPLARGPRKS